MEALPQFQPGEQVQVTIDNATTRARVISYEPAEGARGFRGPGWVYCVRPDNADFGCYVRESDIHRPTAGPGKNGPPDCPTTSRPARS